MKAVVTGVAGFIGSHLVEALLDRGDEIIGVDCFSPYYETDRKRANLEHVRGREGFSFIEADINALELREILDGVDVVYHLAGQPGVRASWGKEFDVYLALNVLTTQKLLEAAKEVGLRRFVLASSSSVYGQAQHFPTKESEAPLPVSPYGVTKFGAEQLCHLYKTAYDVPSTMLRYFSIFGPRQRPDMAFSRFIDAALGERPLKVLGDGRQSRDFTYVGDAVAATLAAATSSVPGRTYNVAGGCQATVLEVIGSLERLLGRTLEREHLDPVPGDPRKTGADISAARRDLDYVPAVGLDEGLTRQLEQARAAAD